ncbi:GroES-like protein [Myriangium duriaei CBS 260.36]|uniref:GroES-like protein n=1 Tax=Myriangium duriaei CBS 260.36 TaxID=1168546 RepID=A0A9P4J825_9PEZI|nr:GroES-like protein [Myriangium duriaei CBS 260.36]
MRALRLTAGDGGVPNLSLENVPRPSLGANEVLVKIVASAINPSDILNSKGGFNHTHFPITPGRDYAGIVADGPADLVGKEVFGTGGAALGFDSDGPHAEYLLVPQDAIAFKPKNLSFAQAATLGVPFTTAALGLHRAQVKAGESVLVIGASGSVGSAACQVAKQIGCKVLTAARRDWADVNTATDPTLQKAKELTGGQGPDVVFEATGSTELMHAGLQILAPGGRLSFISAPRKGSTDFTFDMKQLYREEKIIIGCNSVRSKISDTAKDLTLTTSAFEMGDLQAPTESSLEQIEIDHAVEAYQSGAAKKFVIVFKH